MADSSFKLYIQAALDKVKSLANIKSDIKNIEPKLKIKLQGTLDSTATKKEVNAKIKSIKPTKVKVDADTSALTKKMKKLEEEKTETVIKPKVDNSEVISSLKQTQKETKSLFDRFMSGAVGVNLVHMSVQKVTQAIHQAIQAAKELDSIKTNIQMVSGATDSQVNSMMSSYNSLAKQLSSTTKEVGEAANEFLRMGESVENTNELIRSSQILSKVGMIDSADAASYLISSLKGYKVAAEDSIDIVSKLTSVDLEAAVSAGGLAEALSRCANIANNSGTAMDRLIGYAAAIGETTQESMSVVGNALKSIYSRMSNIKIGRFIDDETGESLSDTEAVLNKLGIQLRDTMDTYRSFDDVLDDIGKRWSSFTQVEQNAISVAMAGNVQRERFIALMNNYSTALEYSEVAANSAGKALERYAVYQDSIEAKTNELTAALESLSTNIISEELYSGIIQATTGIVEFLDNTNLLKGTLAGLMAMGISNTFVSMATGIISAAKSTAQLTAAMALFNKGRSIENLKDIGAACKGLSDKQLKLVLSTEGLRNTQRLTILEGIGLEAQERQQTLATLGFAAAEDVATASTFSLRGAFNSLKVAIASNPIGVVITAIGLAVTGISIYNRLVEESRQKTIDALEESSNAYKTAKSDLENLQKELQETSDRIAEIETTDGITLVDPEEYDRLVETNKELERTIALKKIDQQSSARQAASDAVRLYGKIFGDAPAPSQENVQSFADEELFGARLLTVNNKDINDLLSAYLSLQDVIKNTKAEMDALVSNDDEESQNRLIELQDQLELSEEYLTDYSSLITEYSQTYQNILDGINAKKETGLELTASEIEVYNNVNTALDLISNTLLPVQERLDNLISKNGWKDSLTELFNSEKSLNEITETLSATYPELSSFMDEVGMSVDDLSEKFKTLGEVQGSVLDEPLTLFTQLNNSKDSLDKFQSSVKSAADAYATLLSGNYTSSDLLDSIQAINQAVTDMKGTLDWEEIGSLDELQDKLEDVSRSYAESILSGTGIDIESDFGKMLTDIIQQMYEVEAKFTGMNAQFDRLQASYKTLTDTIEYYNETGFINLDTLQSLLTADENLIKMLEVENGQLVINQEAYEELVAVQLLEFKEKLDNAAAAEIEALALNKAEQATNSNAQASADAVAKLDAETEAFNRNTSAAIANAMQKAQGAGVSNEEIQGVLDKYAEIWNAAINNYSNDFPTFMNGAKSAGSSAGKTAGEAFTDALDKELTALDKKMEAGYIDFNDYIQARLGLIEDYYSKGKLSADEYYSYLNKHYDTQLSYMDKVVNSVTRRINKEIEDLQKNKDSIKEYYDLQIEALQKEKSLLSEANEQRQKQKQLQESLYNLERARNQRTTLQYSEDKGLHYVASDSAIRTAQDEVADAQYQIRISEIEKSISKLEEARDNETSAIDEMISKLNEYANEWKNIANEYTWAQEDLIAAQVLGAEWENDILNGRLDVLKAFKDEYIRIQQAMVDATHQAAQAMANEQNTTISDSSGGKKIPLVDDSNNPYTSTSGGGGGSVGLHELGGNIRRNMELTHFYGSGTDNAEKGLNLVGEDGDEVYFDNDGHVGIVTEPTLIPMEGGEVVKNERDTKKLLDPENIQSVDNIGITNGEISEAKYTTLKNGVKLLENGTIIKPDGTELRPIQPGDKIYDLTQKFNAYIQKQGSMVAPISAMQKDMERLVNSISTVNNVSNSNSRTQQVNMGDINITCPGVTDKEVMQQIGVALDHKFSGLHLDAMQESMKR